MSYQLTIEQDEQGMFIGEVAGLQPCYSQGKTIPELLERMVEVTQGSIHFLRDLKKSQGLGQFSVSMNIDYAAA